MAGYPKFKDDPESNLEAYIERLGRTKPPREPEATFQTAESNISKSISSVNEIMQQNKATISEQAQLLKSTSEAQRALEAALAEVRQRLEQSETTSTARGQAQKDAEQLVETIKANVDAMVAIFEDQIEGLVGQIEALETASQQLYGVKE